MAIIEGTERVEEVVIDTDKAGTIDVKIGERELQGDFVVAVVLEDEGHAYKANCVINGFRLDPLKLLGMIEALDDAKKRLLDKAIAATIQDILGE